MIGILGDIMDVTIGELTATISHIHKEATKSEKLREIAEKVIKFSRDSEIPIELIMIAIIYLIWEAGNKLEEDLIESLKSAKAEK
jgi:hypothetical protein